MSSPEVTGRGRVAAIVTRPETVLTDLAAGLERLDLGSLLAADAETVLRIDRSRHRWFPAVGTTPWQLEGAILALRAIGHDRLLAIPGDAGDPRRAAMPRHPKHAYLEDKYGLAEVGLTEPAVGRVRYEPTRPFLILDRLFPGGVTVPEPFVGRNVVHLPMLRPETYLGLTAAMANAVGGVPLDGGIRVRAVAHEVLVDLLQVQQDTQRSTFAVVDATLVSERSDPTTRRWQERNVLVAGGDQVAVDAVAARLLGFDPMSVPFIRLAHEKGLGVGDPAEIELVGTDRSLAEWAVSPAGVAEGWRLPSQPEVPKRWREPAANSLLGSAGWFLVDGAHRILLDPIENRARAEQALGSGWGRLYEGYGDGRAELPIAGPLPGGVAAAAAGMLVAAALVGRKTGRGPLGDGRSPRRGRVG